MIPTRETDEHGNIIETRRYIMSQYRIEYNADLICRIDERVIVEGPSKGARQTHLYPSEIVNSAQKVAEDEDREFLRIEDCFPKTVAVSGD